MRKHRAEHGVDLITDVADEPLTREVSADDYSSLGSHVASVLEAAMAAAANVRQEAEAEATGIREAAQREAAAKISDASAEASRVLHEAEGLRAESEEAAKRMTERADAFAAKKRKDADTEAAEILRKAETIASHQHAEMITREKALHDSVELAEQRLGHLVKGLRELADQLDEVLNAKTLEGWNEPALDEVLTETVRST
jgi:hypothetical protein